MQNGVKLRMNSSVNIKMLNESLNSKFDLANYYNPYSGNFEFVRRASLLTCYVNPIHGFHISQP